MRGGLCVKGVFIGCIVMIAFMPTACENRPSASPEKSEPPSVPKVIVEKEKSERQHPLPPEVKIRLKRDAKDNYSWELSGSDVDQVLKVDEKLRKRITAEQGKEK